MVVYSFQKDDLSLSVHPALSKRFPQGAHKSCPEKPGRQEVAARGVMADKGIAEKANGLIKSIDPATQCEMGTRVSKGNSGGDPVKYGTKTYDTPMHVYDWISEPGSPGDTRIESGFIGSSTDFKRI